MKPPLVPIDRPRGQPLLVLAFVLGGWLVLRVLLWETPFAELSPVNAVVESFAAANPIVIRPPAAENGVEQPVPYRRSESSRAVSSGSFPALAMLAYRAVPPPYLAVAEPEMAPNVPWYTSTCENTLSPQEVCVTGMIASSAWSESPPALDGQSATPSVMPQRSVRRWWGDTWLLLRKDSAAPLAAGTPAYGRSQAGAVLRYRLASSSGYRPVAYARATRALAGAREAEIAAGLAARPVPALPASVSAELRVYDSAAGREVRPAVFAVTELPPVELPFGLRGEAYAQAGYVGGTFATAFADGQARIDRRVARLGESAQLRLGAAAWGGAQKGAERFDIGPSANLSFPLGAANARLALDYRLRVGGDAEPGNGPALTFSAGF